MQSSHEERTREPKRRAEESTEEDTDDAETLRALLHGISQRTLFLLILTCA